MSRITDALKRASGGSVPGPVADGRPATPIHCFAPGQPAVVSPWDVRDEPEDPTEAESADPAPHPLRLPSVPADLSAGLLTRCNPDLAERVQGPSGARGEKLVLSPAMPPVARAQYNKLAAALHQAQVERGLKVVMVISPGAAEGKSLTSCNLALTFSEAYRRRVLLIDADLRRPTIHEQLHLSNSRGLHHILRTDPVPLQRVGSQLWVLAAGERDQGDPSKVLTSEALHAFMDEARSKFDWILLDTPPLGAVPDARLLSPMADGALLVTQAGRTGCDEVKLVAETLDSRLLLGVVMNHVDDSVIQRAPDQYYD